MSALPQWDTDNNDDNEERLAGPRTLALVLGCLVFWSIVATVLLVVLS